MPAQLSRQVGNGCKGAIWNVDGHLGICLSAGTYLYILPKGSHGSWENHRIVRQHLQLGKPPCLKNIPAFKNNPTIYQSLTNRLPIHPPIQPTWRCTLAAPQPLAAPGPSKLVSRQPLTYHRPRRPNVPTRLADENHSG